MLDEALSVIRSSRLHLWEPELCRLRGEVAHRLGEPPDDVKRWLTRALRLSRKQKAPGLELRAAMSLCRLGIPTDERNPHDRLAELTGAFAEGFDTPDLQDARRLLDGAAGAAAALL